MDRTTGRLPDGTDMPLGEGPPSAETTGELRELGDLGDEDIIADGGTQIMSREPELAPSAPVSTPPPVPKAPSSLDALAATIPAKSKPEPIAPAALAKIPPAPKTEPIHELDPDDLEEEEQRRIERTQPFDRSRLFGAPRPGDGLPGLRTVTAAPPAQLQSTQLSAAQPARRPSVQVPAAQTTPPTPAQVTQASAAWQPAPAPRVDLAFSPTPAPARASAHVPVHLPSVVINEPSPPQQNRPASIAPLALDIAPAGVVPDATLRLPPVRHVPGVPKTNTPVIAAALAAGLALCAAAVIALVSFSSDGSGASTKSMPTVAAKPREAQKGAVRSAVIETPETTPQKAAAPPGTQDEDGTPVYSPGALPSAPALREASGTSSHATSPSSFAPAAPARTTLAPPQTTARPAKPAAAPAQPAAAPEPAPPPVAAAPPPPPRPSAPPPTTGAIEVPGSLMTVMVDGDYKRVQNGRIVVTCGKHRVNAGRGTQMVDVPCGGVASVM